MLASICDGLLGESVLVDATTSYQNGEEHDDCVVPDGPTLCYQALCFPPIFFFTK